MDNRKNDAFYIEKAGKEIEAIQRYMGQKSYREFVDDEQALDAVMFRMIQLVEDIKNLSADFKASHPDVPWGKIIGFRNGIVHEYGKTDFTIVYEAATQGVATLKDLFENV